MARMKAVMAAVLVMEKEGVSQAFGVPVHIVEHVAHWMVLEEDDRTRLGRPGLRLQPADQRVRGHRHGRRCSRRCCHWRAKRGWRRRRRRVDRRLGCR